MKFNVKDRRFPKWENIKPDFKFVNDLENIDVELLSAPSLDEILAMIDDGSFIPFFKSFIRLLFDIRSKPDCLNI